MEEEWLFMIYDNLVQSNVADFEAGCHESCEAARLGAASIRAEW